MDQDIYQNRLYKLLTSLLMGLIGFAVNFQAIKFDFPPFETGK